MKSVALLIISALLSCQFVFATGRNDSVRVAEDKNKTIVRELVGAGIGIAVNAAVTELLKHSVSETRPDFSDNSSFPSRHASYAFTFAAIASHELSRLSPFWTIAAHSAANAVAMQRVYASRHYPGDVLAGAAIGLGSAELGYALSRLIFPTSNKSPLTPLENMPGLSAATVALISFDSRQSALSMGCGVESSLSFSLPTSDAFALGCSFKLRSQPVFRYDSYIGSLNGAALSLDAYYVRPLGLWAIDALASAGILRNFDRPENIAASWTGLLDFSAGISRRVARALSVGARLGCDITDRPRSCCALTVALTTKAEF